MTKSKLSKLYLITPETFTKLNSEKKVSRTKIKKSEKNIDLLHVLKNIQRRKVPTKFIENKIEAEKIKRMENILTELTSKLNSTPTQNKKFNDFGIQTEPVTQNKTVQTEDALVDAEINVENKGNQNSDWDDVKQTNEHENLYITPVNNSPVPIIFSGRKQIRPKRNASPLIRQLHKVKIDDEGTVSTVSYPSTPRLPKKNRALTKAIDNLKNAKILGSRTAKQKAKVRLEQLLKWKHI